MENIKVDRTKLITQAKYAKLIGLSRQRVNQMVKNKEVNTIVIKGAILIHL
jgi:hypothetical protein